MKIVFIFKKGENKRKVIFENIRREEKERLKILMNYLRDKDTIKSITGSFLDFRYDYELHKIKVNGKTKTLKELETMMDDNSLRFKSKLLKRMNK